MPIILATPINQIELMPGSAIRLTDITWESYLALLQDLMDNRASRIAYSEGVLELRMPSQLHEVINRVLAAIIHTLAEELGLDFNDLGSVTLNRADLAKGVEPDSCFYIQNVEAGQGISDSGLVSLPPDLAVEVDIANKSDSKLRIYQAMGVPEVWLYQQNRVTILWLEGDSYVEKLTSRSLKLTTVTQLNEWVQLRKNGTDLTVIRAVRPFCNQQGR